MLVVFICLVVTRPTAGTVGKPHQMMYLYIVADIYTEYVTYILIHFVCATTISETNSMGNIFKLSLSFLVSQSFGARLLYLLTNSHA